MTDECNGARDSLEQSQQLLSTSRQRESQLQGQVAALQSQIQVLSSSKQQLIHKVETAESTIEMLNAQLQELGASESLVRAKDQHESIVSGMRQKHDQEILLLKQKLDSAQAEKEQQV